jgi:hypothetical protein
VLANLHQLHFDSSCRISTRTLSSRVWSNGPWPQVRNPAHQFSDLPSTDNANTGLESLSDPSSTHYAYYDIGANAGASLGTAIDQLEVYISKYGPFDGVLGFSQGAGLAAMLLVRRAYLSPENPSPFKCAVFFSPVSVYDPVAYLERGQQKVVTGMVNGNYPINIPTLLVYGKNDGRKGECETLVKTCNPNVLEVLVHDGGHEIPGIGLRGEMATVVKLMRRVVYRAESLDSHN